MPDANVRVICRFRPVNQRELKEYIDEEKAKTQIRFVGDTTVEIISPGKETLTFTFDRVFHSDATQQSVYELAAKDTIEDILQGYNGTIFAYGQTGAGKSYTMFGPDLSEPNLKGIIPRACAHIFDYINNDETGTEFTIKCSFLEIYKEVIHDLLNPKNTNLRVRETPSRGVWVENLSEVFVTCEQEVMDLIKLGEKFRATAATNMNAVSSRSHSLFILTLSQKARDGSTKIGKLNLADLAGSEKVGKTGAVGETLEEAKKINQSLSALGNCINALTKAKRGHVPYRDSKLTFILRESLGGNAKTTLVIACSPHLFNLEESISTLRFGQRAKSIKNKVKINQERSVAELEAIIEKLTAELTRLRQYNEALERELVAAKGGDFNIETFRKKILGELARKQQQQQTPTSNESKSEVASPLKETQTSALEAPLLPVAAASSAHNFNNTNNNNNNNLGDIPMPTAVKTKDVNDLSSTNEINSPRPPAATPSPSLEDENIYDPMSIAEAQVAYDKLKEEMEMQVQDLTDELNSLKEEHEQRNQLLKRANEELEKQKEETTNLLGQLEKEKKELENLRSKYEFELKKKDLEIENLLSSASIIKEDNDNLRKKLESATQKLEIALTENQTLKEKSTELENKNQTLESKIERLCSQITLLEKSVTHKSMEKEQNEQSENEKNEKLQQLQDKVTKLEDELDTSRIELQETQTKLKLLRQEKELVESALTNAKQKLSILEHSSKNFADDKSSKSVDVSAAKPSTTESLNKHNQELYTLVDQVRDENQSLKKKLLILESELERTRLECASKDKRLATEKQKTKLANETLKRLQKEFQELKLAQQIEKFEIETKLKDTEIQLLTEQNQRLLLTTEIEKLKRISLEREIEMKQHNEQFSRLQRDYKEETAKSAILQKQLQENEKRMGELEKNLEELSQENQKLKAALKNNKTSSSENLTTVITNSNNANTSGSTEQQRESQVLAEYVRRLQQRSGKVVRPVRSSSGISASLQNILHFWKEAPKEETNKVVFKKPLFFGD
jgi:kinesin family protein 5